MSDKSSNARTFTVQGSDIGFQGGVYRSTTTPVAAARKAATILFRMIQHGVLYSSDHVQHIKYKNMAKYAQFKNQKTIKILLRETTRNGTGKSYYYEATMQKLEDPVIINRNGKEIRVDKKVDVKVCKDPHDHHQSSAKTQ